MILATHALVGAVIGKNITNPWEIIAVSIVVHFLIDHLKHGEYVEVFSKNTSVKNSGWKVFLDLSVGLSVVFAIIQLKDFDSSTSKNILVGVTSSILPDFITSLYWKFRWNFLGAYYAFHSWVHKFPRYSPERLWTFRNARNDIIISLLAIAFLLIK
jgi:hypothetical protein